MESGISYAATPKGTVLQTDSHFRRQKEDKVTACVKAILLAYNALLLLAGCVALGIGIWQSLPGSGSVAGDVLPVMIPEATDSECRTAVYVLVAGGVVLMLLASLGFFAAIAENKIALIVYAGGLVVPIVVLGVAGYLSFAAFTLRTSKDSIEVMMKNSLTNDYGTRRDSQITEVWDIMQSELQCCGVSGNTTSSLAWIYYSSSTEWSFKQNSKQYRKLVPDSCCADGDMALCTGLKPFNGPPLFFDSHLPTYTQVNPYLYTTGCLDKLFEYASTYTANCRTVTGYTAVGVAIFSVLGILAATLFLLRLRSGASTNYSSPPSNV